MVHMTHWISRLAQGLDTDARRVRSELDAIRTHFLDHA